MDLLPEMSSEDLDQADLQGGDLSVHEDTGEIKLHLETNIHVCTVDSGGPPQREATIWNLVQTRALGVGELLVPKFQKGAEDSVSEDKEESCFVR